MTVNPNWAQHNWRQNWFWIRKRIKLTWVTMDLNIEFDNNLQLAKISKICLESLTDRPVTTFNSRKVIISFHINNGLCRNMELTCELYLKSIYKILIFAFIFYARPILQWAKHTQIYIVLRAPIYNINFLMSNYFPWIRHSSNSECLICSTGKNNITEC